jgi:DNA-cytosine methyltransferase
MRVLSLFDGLGGGLIALKKLNIKPDIYYRSEIEPYANTIFYKNNEDINYVDLGDVREIDTNNLKNIYLLIGGSPCTNFSFSGKRNGMTTKENIEVTSLEQYLKLKEQRFEFEGQSYLFWEFVRILKAIKPKYFLLENVKMAKKWQNIIDNTLNTKAIMFDSSLVSAQHRKRLYWTNINNIKPLNDKNITLKDVINKINENVFEKNIKKENEYLYKPFLVNNKKFLISKSVLPYIAKNIRKQTDKIIPTLNGFCSLDCKSGFQDHKIGIIKTPTLRAGNSNTYILDTISYKNCFYIRKLLPIEWEKLQNLPNNYTEGVPTTQRYKMIGNGWTIDIIVHILKHIKENGG